MGKISNKKPKITSKRPLNTNKKFDEVTKRNRIEKCETPRKRATIQFADMKPSARHDVDLQANSTNKQTTTTTNVNIVSNTQPGTTLDSFETINPFGILSYIDDPENSPGTSNQTKMDVTTPKKVRHHGIHQILLKTSNHHLLW